MKMRQVEVILIQVPPFNRKPNKRMQPHLGLASIAALLLTKGITLQIIDCEAENISIEMAATRVKESRTKIVGITAPTEDRFNAIRLAKLIKAQDGDIVVVMGGPHFGFAAEDTLENVPDVDLVIMGEGEFTMLDVVVRLQGGDKRLCLDGIPGCAFRRHHGEVAVNPPRPPVQNIDELPLLPWHLFHLECYNRTLSYERKTRAIGLVSSRGCIHNCTFCSNAANKPLRLLSPSRFVDQVQFLHEECGFPGINIQDDDFSACPSHAEAICREIIRRNIHLRWYCSMRVDGVTTELLRLMKTAGCVSIGYGIEVASDRLLQSINKRTTTEAIWYAIEQTHCVGIEHIALFLMFSLPGQTLEDLRESSHFLVKIDRLMTGKANKSLFLGEPTLVYPGTEIENTARVNGNVFPRGFTWSQYYETPKANIFHSNRFVPHFENPGLSLEDIAAFATQYESVRYEMRYP